MKSSLTKNKNLVQAEDSSSSSEPKSEEQNEKYSERTFGKDQFRRSQTMQTNQENGRKSLTVESLNNDSRYLHRMPSENSIISSNSLRAFFDPN